METLSTILLILAIGAINAFVFILGAKTGQKVVKGEEVELPSLNPLEAYRKHEARKEAEAKQDKFDTIMQNIECYDGTGRGQKDVN
jgi:hypothetical protein